jgi:choline kinase
LLQTNSTLVQNAHNAKLIYQILQNLKQIYSTNLPNITKFKANLFYKDLSRYKFAQAANIYK